MNTFKQSTVAVLLSVIGAASSMSALALTSPVVKEQRIEVISDSDHDAKVFVISDGQDYKVDVSNDVLSDKDALENALSDLPDDIREKVVEQISKLHISDHMIKIGEGSDNETMFSWSGETVDKDVVVIEVEQDGTSGIESGAMIKKVLKKLNKGDSHKVFEFKLGGKHKSEALVRMLDKGSFTVEELDKIQAALDAKR